MYKLTAVIITLLFCTTQAFSQAADIAAIQKQNRAFLDAIVHRDTAALSKVLADDFILVNPGGKKHTKADNLANAITPELKVLSVTIDSANVRLVNNTVGIITAWTTFVIEANGKQTTGKNCYQDVYEKRRDGWKAISAHVTLLGTQ